MSISLFTFFFFLNLIIFVLFLKLLFPYEEAVESIQSDNQCNLTGNQSVNIALLRATYLLKDLVKCVVTNVDQSSQVCLVSLRQRDETNESKVKLVNDLFILSFFLLLFAALWNTVFCCTFILGYCSARRIAVLLQSNVRNLKIL